MHVIKEAAKTLVAKLGFQTNRRIVVFESDDWGAVRVPDSDSLAAFENRFPSFRLDHYQSFDGLEKKADVSALSSLLRENAVRFRASAPVFTLNFATANPDFNRCVPGNVDVAHFGFEPIDKTYRIYTETREYLISFGWAAVKQHCILSSTDESISTLRHGSPMRPPTLLWNMPAA